MFKFKHISILIVLASATFLFSNEILNGSLKNKENLSGELKSPADSLYMWKIGSEAPFKYRILHRGLVSGVYRLVSSQKDDNKVFFATYKSIAFLLHLLVIVIFYFFLIKINLSQHAFAGSIIFALLPPFLLAYNVPIHTREDILTYCILILGLFAIVENNDIMLSVIIILGVFNRETLLILPFVNLFFNRKQEIYLRLLISGIAFGIFLGLRWYLGVDNYDYWEGFYWNINNLSQVFGFSCITFGALWIPFLANIIKRERANNQVEIIQQSSTSVLLLILLTTFLGGIFNEIRLLYLLAPWVIVISINYYSSNSNHVLSVVQSRSYFKFGLLLLIGLTIPALIVMSNIRDFIKPSQYDIPYNLWIIVGVTQTYLGLITLPIFSVKLRKWISLH